jgi:hypothetical protein
VIGPLSEKRTKMAPESNEVDLVRGSNLGVTTSSNFEMGDAELQGLGTRGDIDDQMYFELIL